MLPSGNDAAQAICDSLGEVCFKKLKYIDPEHYRKMTLKKLNYFGKYFVDEMNLNAELLGLCSTYFANPHGLMNKINQSSALDVGIIMNEGIKSFPLFKSVISTKYEH